MRHLSRTMFSLAVVGLAACAGSAPSGVSPSGSMNSTGLRITAPNPDPRVGLKAGLQDAASAIWNMDMVSHSPPPEGFAGVTNSDLAFTSHYVIQGNYNGFQIWDIANPASPKIVTTKLCPASQSDVSVYHNLLFVSAESGTARLDCGKTAPTGTVSPDRIRGLRIFDMTDIENPKYIANVQTCRGSHTHTVVEDPNDHNNVYVYISGTSGVRPAEELPGCISDANDPNTSQFKIEIIQIPLAHPEQAHIVSSAKIFETAPGVELAYPKSHGQPRPVTPQDSMRLRVADAMAKIKPLTPTSTTKDTATYNAALDKLRAQGLTGVPVAAGTGRAGRAGRAGGAPRPAGPRTLTQCHDITVYPAVGLAGGACAGMGLLLDIHDVAHPRRIDAVADSNFSFWHSATFSNDGKKVLFSDEWGGGGAAYCRATDPKNWGGDAIFNIVNGKMTFQNYYKLPAPQTPLENCVAHNGSLIPVPGREVMVQAWYQGGLSVFDWTDSKHPTEIAFFDRGPNDATRLVGGGFWSVYWYNGVIVGSEMQRGLDVFQLKPSAALTQNELDAAKLVHISELNVQGQPHFVWPADLVVAKAYMDQIERDGGLSAARVAAIRSDIDRASSMSGAAKRTALTALASAMQKDVKSAKDKTRTQAAMQVVRDVANATN